MTFLDNLSDLADPTESGIALGAPNPDRSMPQKIADLNDAVEDIRKQLVKKPFVNASAKTAITSETLINDTTPGSANPGTWFVRGNCDAPAFGTFLSKNFWGNGFLKVGQGEAGDPSNFSYSGINFTTPVAVGANGVITLFLSTDSGGTGQIDSQNFGRSAKTREPYEVMELVVSDGPTFTGNVVTASLQPMTHNLWYQHWIPLQGLTTVKCIGVRQTDYSPWPNGGESKRIRFSTISWGTATEFDVAAASATPATVVVGQSYVPSIAQRVRELPPAIRKLDLRKRTGTVRLITDWEGIVEDGSADTTAVINQALLDMNDGDILRLTEGAKYNAGYLSLNNKQNVTFDLNGATLFNTGLTGAMIAINHCDGITLTSSAAKKARLILKHDNVGFGAYTGNLWTNVLGSPGTVGTTKTLSTSGDMAQSQFAAWHAEDEDGFISTTFTLSQTAAPGVADNDCYIELGQKNAPPAPSGFTYSTSGGLAGGPYYYRYSYVGPDGKESGLSAPGKAVIPTAWGKVTMNLPSNRYATSIRIYRGGLSQAAMMDPIFSVPATWTTFTDNTTATQTPTHSLTLPAVTDAGPGNITPSTRMWWVTQIDAAGRETATNYTKNSSAVNGKRSGTTSGQMTITLPSWTGVSRMRVYRSYVATQGVFSAGFVGEPSFGAATFTDNVAVPDQHSYPPFWPVIGEASKAGPCPNLPEVILNLTTTPTDYNLKFRHTDHSRDDLMYWRIAKIGAGVNTITLAGYTDHTGQQRENNGQFYMGVDHRDHGHAIAVGGQDCHSITIENIDIQKPLGDLINFQSNGGGMRNRKMVIRNVSGFACGRQGVAPMAGGDWLFERFNVNAGGGQAIDVEWEEADKDTLTLVDCEFKNIKTNLINIVDMVSGIKMTRCRFLPTGSGIKLNAHSLEITDCYAPGSPVEIFGGKVYINGLVSMSLKVRDWAILKTVAGGELWSGGGSVIDNVRLLPVIDCVSPLDVNMRDCKIGMVSLTYPFDGFGDQANTATSSGPVALRPAVRGPDDFRPDGRVVVIDGPQSAMMIDTGHWKGRYPDTIKGDIVATNPWFPTGLNMEAEPLLNVSGLSSGAVKPNNLSGTVAVLAGQTTATVTFPTKSYDDLTAISVAAVTTTITSPGFWSPVGTLAGTYYWAVAAARANGGPRAVVSNEATLTITGPNNAAALTISNFLKPTRFIEGLTIYRGLSSGNYNTRYDVRPDGLFNMVVDSATGKHGFGDLGTKINFSDFPGTSTLAADIDPPTGYQQLTPVRSTSGHDAWNGSRWLHATDQTGWEPDASYRLLPVASWDTTIAVTAKRMGGFDLHFGVACPTVGGTVDWMLVR